MLNRTVIAVLSLSMSACIAAAKPVDEDKAAAPDEVLKKVNFCSPDGYASTRKQYTSGIVQITIGNMRCRPQNRAHPNNRIPPTFKGSQRM